MLAGGQILRMLILLANYYFTNKLLFGFNSQAVSLWDHIFLLRNLFLHLQQTSKAFFDGPATIRSIANSIANGDELAFAELFREWYPKIYDAGILLARSHEAAEKLIQDVFMKVCLKRASLPSIEDFGAYLFLWPATVS